MADSMSSLIGTLFLLSSQVYRARMLGCFYRRFKARIALISIAACAACIFCLISFVPHHAEYTCRSVDPGYFSAQLQFGMDHACLPHTINTSWVRRSAEHRVSTTLLQTTTDDYEEKDEGCGRCRKSVLLFRVSQEHQLITDVLDRLQLGYHTVELNADSIQHGISQLLYPPVQQQSRHIKLFIFEDFASYTNLSPALRTYLDTYCRMHRVGVIAFFNDGRSFSTEPGSVTNVSLCGFS